MSANSSVEFIREYDENDVFNRLFAEKKIEHRVSTVSNLDQIFGDIVPPAEVINVRDFLPKYDT